jgi:hypothetical protein
VGEGGRKLAVRRERRKEGEKVKGERWRYITGYHIATPNQAPDPALLSGVKAANPPCNFINTRTSGPELTVKPGNRWHRHLAFSIRKGGGIRRAPKSEKHGTAKPPNTYTRTGRWALKCLPWLPRKRECADAGSRHCHGATVYPNRRTLYCQGSTLSTSWKGFRAQGHASMHANG